MRKFLRQLRATIFVILGGVCILPWSFTHAATITDIYDQPSSLVISAASNHKIVFTTASNIDAGDTVTLTFASQFTTATIIEDDVDIADDGVDLTTASNCSGTDQTSVAIASNILTITICAGDGGDIVAGSSVVVEIGTNAASSGSGTHQITNPSAVATYYITLGGTFGDFASIPLPFVASDTGGVSGTIIASDTGGGDSGCGACGSGQTPTPEPTPEPIPEPVPDIPPVPEPEPTPTDPAPITPPAPDTTPSSAPSSTPTHAPSSSSGGTPAAPSPAQDAEPTPDTEPVTPTTTEPDTTPSSSPDISASIIVDGSFTLLPDDSTFITLGGTQSTIRVDIDASTAVTEARLILNHVAYLLTPSDSGFTASVVLPTVSTSFTVEIDFVDGTTSNSSYLLNIQGSGMVYEVITKSWVPVSGAMVTVYQSSGGQLTAWDASAYGSTNPIIVGDSGAFSFYVPNGTYTVIASHSGYQDGTISSLVIRNHILAPSIELQPEPIVTIPVTAGLEETLSFIRAMPEVQIATNIAVPTTAVLAATSIIVLASSFNLLPYLQYLFTAPFLFFARRKRHAFGTVYNAANKLPVDLAIIRLFSSPENKLVRSVVTNQKGEYLLTVAAGSYTLKVMKSNFVFPSLILQGKKDDGTYLDVYTGQIITVSDQEATIAANIPLDPAGVVAVATPRHAALIRLLRSFQQIIAISGIILAFIVLIISPTIFTAIMCAVQLVVYILVRRLARVRKPKGWGIVYDEKTKQPVSNTVVRLFEPVYNKLIETVLTDRFGRYSFLVGPSQYYISYDKPGFTNKIVRPIDYTARTGPTALALDIPLAEISETKEV